MLCIFLTGIQERWEDLSKRLTRLVTQLRRGAGAFVFAFVEVIVCDVCNGLMALVNYQGVVHFINLPIERGGWKSVLFLQSVLSMHEDGCTKASTFQFNENDR